MEWNLGVTCESPDNFVMRIFCSVIQMIWAAASIEVSQ